MPLYVLKAANAEALFGTPEAPTPKPDVDVIAQRPDCSAFLVLSNTPYPELDPFAGFEGFDFTYRQDWGLTINDAVVARTISDLRARAYPPMADYLDAVVKNDPVAVSAYVEACVAVKLRYPKMA